jgi:hypothetical protein
MTWPPASRDSIVRSTRRARSASSRKKTNSLRTTRSKRPSGHCAGTSITSTVTLVWALSRFLASSTALAAESEATTSSPRRASPSVRTPMEQAGSKMRRYRSRGSEARVMAYFRRSYQRVVKPHGSGSSSYRSSKYEAG